MRWQLFLAFGIIIAMVLGSSWWLALRTTTHEFALLVSDDNQQQARLIAPTLLEEYNQSGDWGTVQATLEEQIAQQNRLNVQLAPMWGQNQGGRRGVVSFSMGAVQPYPANEIGMAYSQGCKPDSCSQPKQDSYAVDFTFHWPQEFMFEGFNLADFISLGSLSQTEPVNVPPVEVLPADSSRDRFFVVDGGTRPRRDYPQAIFTEAPSIPWTVGNFLLADQRALVIDSDGMVVIDTAKQFLGKEVEANDLEAGVPLYTDAGQIGTLLVAPRNGVYTLQQNTFLEEVRQGFLISAGLSAALALLLAFWIADRATRPIRSLTQASERLQQGEWGYQVDFTAQNEIGRLAYAFNQMSRHLAEQRDLRARLVDDLSHELNTPLSLMQLELQGMSDGLQSPSEAAAHLTQELGEVSELVADLVFLANRDAAPPPVMQPLNLNELVSSTVKRFENSAKQNKQQTLQFIPQEGLDSILGDPYLVGRAVSNLISNAMRHTPAGGEITVVTRQTGAELEVSVQDTGEGIAAEHLPHIFERFYRTDSSRARHSGGRGLGLAIVQQIMAQHQGKVMVESQVGQGSTFRLVWEASAIL